MLETVKYLIGSADPSGYGSKSTAEEVTQHCPDLCSIITGKKTDSEFKSINPINVIVRTRFIN